MHRSTLAGCDVIFDLCVSRAVTKITRAPLIRKCPCSRRSVIRKIPLSYRLRQNSLGQYALHGSTLGIPAWTADQFGEVPPKNNGKILRHGVERCPISVWKYASVRPDQLCSFSQLYVSPIWRFFSNKNPEYRCPLS